jgi:hypothetical protein
MMNAGIYISNATTRTINGLAKKHRNEEVANEN